MARDALALMDDAGWASAHIVGHSLGGLIAMEFALMARSRVRSLIGPFVVTLHLLALVTAYVPAAQLKMKKGGAHHESTGNLLAPID